MHSAMAGQSFRDYHVFGPKAIAGIGKLPDTVASRSIFIRLRRLGKREAVAELEPWELEEQAAPLRARAEQWASEELATLERARVELPQALSSRARDVWKPLAAIADAVGGDWPGRARGAAVKLSERKRQSADVDETRVLRVIHGAFEETRVGQLSTVELAKALAAAGLIEPAKAENEQAAGFAVKRALAPFDIGPPQKLRFGPIKTRRGYTRSQLEDAWSRYL